MDFFDVVHTQRSVRRFKPDPIPEEMIWTMIDAAIRAPSGSNLQPWIWLVVQDQGKKEAIGHAIRDHFSEAGTTEAMRRSLGGDPSPTLRRMRLGAIWLRENIAAVPVLIIPCLVGVTSPVSDQRTLLAGSSIYGAVQNLMLAARAQGLGTVLTTFNSFMEDVLRRELNISQEAVPVCIVPVGYPDGQRFGPTTRKPVDTVTYWDNWGTRKVHT